MASVFTYDPDPPRVSSPWPESCGPVLSNLAAPRNNKADRRRLAVLADCGITRLEAEPQEGPVEYKLHLLLRPRRRLAACTTVARVSGSNQSKTRERQSTTSASLAPVQTSTLPVPSVQSRQNRLENLTTQLLWRLQQSSSHHSTSKNDLVVPNLSHANRPFTTPSGHGKLLPGLDDSQGALYEIGISDDGAFVGLVRDELDESLITLRTMAHSLGCKVEVTREVIVGQCQWVEEIQSTPSTTKTQRKGDLWVVEALITPDLDSRPRSSDKGSSDAEETYAGPSDGFFNASPDIEERSEQLRISLTGSTTSGKSSLLGILATSTLDDGRGKIRKSLHKHLHEIASGVTSSLVTELIGYRDAADGCQTDVVNFAAENVSQWTDIHESCDGGRLVAVTDSAGHIKYRRTTVRGLLSLAPHWTVCCIAADNEQYSACSIGKAEDAEEVTVGTTSYVSNASKAHLELCLKLGLPLVVAITKLDVASYPGLRTLIAEVLTILKAAGRHVAPMFAKSLPGEDRQLQTLLSKDLQDSSDLFTGKAGHDVAALVPIVLTSAVTGAGIRKLHALLRHLPIPREPHINGYPIANSHMTSAGLFYIDEVFATADARSIALLDGSRPIEGLVVSGVLSYATTELGDTWFIGPFDACFDFKSGYNNNRVHQARSCPVLKQVLTEAQALRRSSKQISESLASRSGCDQNGSTHAEVWRRVRIVSLRNLRLPVRQLVAGQAGTIGITYEDVIPGGRTLTSALGRRVRKGMVMIRDLGLHNKEDLPAFQGLVATFSQHDGCTMVPGSLVKVYIASIRASAKVLAVKNFPRTLPPDDIFAFDESDDNDLPTDVESVGTAATPQEVVVTLEFQGPREWFEVGSQVLVMPERGNSGSVGLDGLVGRITQAIS